MYQSLRINRNALIFACFAFISTIGCGSNQLSKVTQLIQHSQDPESKVETTAVDPAGLLAFAPGEKLIGDVFELMAAVDVPQMYVSMAKASIQRGLAGVDKNRSAGVFAYCPKGQDTPDLLVCIPVNDFEKFLDSANSFGVSMVQEDNQWKGELSGVGAFTAVHQGEYLFLASKTQMLENLPSNVSAVLNDALDSHSVAFQIDVAKLPEDWKNQIWSQLKKTRDESDEELEQYLTEFREYVYGVEEVAIRLDLDSENKKLHFESTVTGKEDSAIARESARNVEMEPSKFAGFGFSKSTFNFHCCSETMANHFRELKRISADKLAGVLDNDPYFKSLNRLVDETLSKGRIDLGATLSTKGGKPNFAIGIHVAGSELAEKMVAETLENAQAADVDVQKGFAEVNGVSLHRLKSSNLDAFVTDFYGRDCFGVIGHSKNELYFSLGEDAYNLLKVCIEYSEKADAKSSVANVNGQLRLLSLARIAAKENFDSQLVDVYRRVRDNDRLLFETLPCKNGFQTNVDVELGFISGALAAIEHIGRVSEDQFNEIAKELQ